MLNFVYLNVLPDANAGSFIEIEKNCGFHGKVSVNLAKTTHFKNRYKIFAIMSILKHTVKMIANHLSHLGWY